jgi:thiamine kinase-like enzyme
MVGRSLPFAAAHNDLTTWNILLDGENMGIVDWEAAEREALPLVDLDYLVVDAVAAARRIRRDIAFAACAGSGPDAQLARRIRHELQSASGIDEDMAELARHACWLGHARNEAARAQPAAPRPFLSILAAVVAA